LVVLALSFLFIYLLYRADLRAYPAKRIWETEGPVGKERALAAVRESEESSGNTLDSDLRCLTPEDPYLAEARWSVDEDEQGSSHVRLVYLLKPVGFAAWLRWKFGVEHKYVQVARERAKRVKREINPS
jgi:hypothetical protein